MSKPCRAIAGLRLAALLFATVLLLALGAPTPGQAAGIQAAANATLIVLDRDGAPLGSAILLSDGTVLTGAGIVGTRGCIGLRTMTGETVQGHVIARDSQRGLAVIRTDSSLGAGLEYAAAPARAGQDVYAIGAPLGHEVIVTRGIVSAAARQPDATVPVFAVRHDATVNAGVEGGALVDGDGRLLGMVRSSDAGDIAGIGWAVSAPDLARLVPLMLSGALRDVPELGLALRPVTPVIAAALNVASAGLLVDSVAPGSRAARAGLIAGDIIVSVEGAVLRVPGDLAWAIDAGGMRSARLSVRRGGVSLPVTLDLSTPGTGLSRTADSVSGGVVESYSFAGLGVLFEDEGRVASVNFHSPAYLGGLHGGDVVLALNGVAVHRAELEALTIRAPVVLLVSRGAETLHVVIDPWRGTAPRAAARRAKALDADVFLF